MWFDGERQPNTLYVASVSRGKDSTAMLRAIQLMGWPLDAICSVDIWFDDTTPAELPPMVAFKDEWDRKCLETFGVPVTRLCAHKRERDERLTYCDIFYRKVSPKRERERMRGAETIRAEETVNHRLSIAEKKLVQQQTQDFMYYGFPIQKGNWCTALKYRAFTDFQREKVHGAIGDSKRTCWTTLF